MKYYGSMAFMTAAIVSLASFIYWTAAIDRQVAKWQIASTVCLKQNARPATVKWSYSGSYSLQRPPLYKVTSVNDLNQVYEIDVYETDLTECSDGLDNQKRRA